MTLEFSPSAKMQKRMCESNGRLEQIQTLLSGYFSTPLQLKLETAKHEQVETKACPVSSKTYNQKRNDLLNDPAVKTVLVELGATITGIEENAEN